MNALLLFAANPIGVFGVDPQSLESMLYLIPLLPLLAALVNGLVGKRLGRANAAMLACGSVLAAFGLSIMVFSAVYPGGQGQPAVPVLYQNVYTWFETPGLHVDLAYGIDRLNSILLLIITGVGLLIHLYSISYMEHDEGFVKFFAFLNLFVGMMLNLVMGANLLVMFVGWEGVGLASYLLIGFWYEDEEKAFAGRKAFIANRVGDFGFLLGIFTLMSVFQTVDLYRRAPNGQVVAPLQEQVEQVLGRGVGLKETINSNEKIEERLNTPVRSGVFGPPVTSGQTDGPVGGWGYGEVITLACLLLFVGATGKSAQLPLYVWLPDAMAGPTPVSALIHAATMVTAGVYMMCRLNFLFSLSETAMTVIAFTGASTALFAAIIGTMQNDLKKVLAYSTVSQLGFMVLGAGVGAYWAASLHLLTHAFFKACLFLGAGSVMHGMMNETNIMKMGGLRKDMPGTAYTFLTATLAITGVLPLSGFFSKDAILDLAKHAHLRGGETTGYVLYGMGTLAALGTAYYMFRAYFLTFEGERRTMRDHHAHEAGLMVFPLVVLAILSVGALMWGIPIVTTENGGHATLWQEYLNPLFHFSNEIAIVRAGVDEPEAIPYLAWGVAVVVALAGFGAAWAKFMTKPVPAPALNEPPETNPLFNIIQHKFYVDEIYETLLINPIKRTANFLWRIVDQLAIDTLVVQGAAIITKNVADVLTLFQNGNTQRYAAMMAISLAALLLAGPLQHLFATLMGR
jgi:NADH-quinone oxidoreductase subunit L